MKRNLRRVAAVLVLTFGLTGVAVHENEKPAAAYCAGVVWRRAAISVTYKWIDVTNHCGRRYGTVVWQRCGMFEWYDSRVSGGCY